MHMLMPGDRYDRKMEHNEQQEASWQRFWENVKGTFAYAKQLTFPSLDRHAILRGRVISISDDRGDDGDITFNVIPEPEYQFMLYYKGRKRPYVVEGRTGQRYETVHNEIKWFCQGKLMPEIEQLRRFISAGKTPLVETRGKWTYDWIHEGWVEMHPVRSLTILSPDAPAL